MPNVLHSLQLVGIDYWKGIIIKFGRPEMAGSVTEGWRCFEGKDAWKKCNRSALDCKGGTKESVHVSETKQMQ